MGYAALSDTRVVIAFWIGAISTLLAAICLLEVIWMRIALVLKERHSHRYVNTAKLWIIQVIAGEAVEAPKIAKRDLPDFLYIWIHYQEILRGDSKTLLNQAIHRFKLEPRIRKLLVKGSFEEQLIAATALGHLGDVQSWDNLVKLLRKPSPLLSITAARALVTIDSAKACNIILPLMIEHRDWMPARLAIILKQADPFFREAFLTYLESSAQQQQPYLLRLMRLLDFAQLNQPLSLVRHYLMTGSDPDLVAACLRLVCHPSELDLVRSRFGDEHWSVQVQIAGVLGLMGTSQDAHYLLSLLNSRFWWVRYRAAQALVSMPFMNRQAIKRLSKSRSDIFARDMLLQMIAEKVHR